MEGGIGLMADERFFSMHCEADTFGFGVFPLVTHCTYGCSYRDEYTGYTDLPEISIPVRGR